MAMVEVVAQGAVAPALDLDDPGPESEFQVNGGARGQHDAQSRNMNCIPLSSG